MGTSKLTDCVLLIDEDTINGFYNAQLLSRLGIAKTVKVIPNATEAVEFIRHCCMSEDGEKYSMLIFLDLYPASFNGNELLSIINQMTKKTLEKVGFIFLTPSLLNTGIPNEKEHNILGAIEKPLSIEKLLKLIDQNDKVTSVPE